MKRSIAKEVENVAFDEFAVKQEAKAFPRGPVTAFGRPYYDTSSTKEALTKLAKEGSLERYKFRPTDLKKTNKVFIEYSNDVFRKIVNREKRRHKESVAWQFRRNIKGSLKHHAKYEHMKEPKDNE